MCCPSRSKVIIATMSDELLWPKRAMISLCALVQSHKSLWEPSHKDYPKRKVRRKIYDELAEELKEMYPAMTFLNGSKATFYCVNP